MFLPVKSCRGNRDSFPTLKECREACEAAGKRTCELPIVIGSCRGAFKRFLGTYASLNALSHLLNVCFQICL